MLQQVRHHHEAPGCESSGLGDLSPNSSTPTHATSLGPVDALRAEVVRALALVEDRTRGLPEAVERLYPGHLMGESKRSHMRTMAQGAEDLARASGLEEELCVLAPLVFRCHDLGRHLEVTLGLDTMRGEERHGELSVTVMRETAVLSGLLPEYQETIFAAVREHSLPKISLRPGTPEWKLCQLLRDQDKLELLRDIDGFFSGPGMLEQMEVHIFPKLLGALGKSKAEIDDILGTLRTDRTGREALQKYLEAVISNTSGAAELPRGRLHPHVLLLAKVAQGFIDGPAASLMWFRGLNREPVSVHEVRSAADAAVLQVLTVFDVTSTSVLRSICEEGLLSPRIAIIARVDGGLATNVALKADQHASTRLGIPPHQLADMRAEAWRMRSRLTEQKSAN